MVRNKTLVLVCAVLAVGLFVLPSALSLFAGQHTFYSGSEVSCIKCHGAEAAELAASGEGTTGATIHSTDIFTKAANSQCTACHQVSSEYNNTHQHATVSPPCVACHNNTIAELQNANESHTKFYEAALAENTTTLAEANAACIACHTQIEIGITWERATTLNFTAGHSVDGWIVDNFTVGTGTNTTTTTGGGYP